MLAYGRGGDRVAVATRAQRAHVAAVLEELARYRGLLRYPPGDQRTGRDNVTWHLTEHEAFAALAAGDPLQWDCSEFCPWVLKCAGLWRWSSPGYTGSHLELLPVYTDARAAGIGALVVFGGGTGHHEAIVHTPDPHGGNPLLYSHGRPGLDVIRLHDEAARQPPGVRLLSIAHL